MRTLSLMLLSLLGTTLAADEVADKAAIEKFIAGLSEPRGEEVSNLFTTHFAPDADRAEAARLVVLLTNPPMSERSTPRFRIRALRFVRPDVALVDSAAKQYGSVDLVRTFAVLFILRREGGQWRIASFRQSLR